MLTRLKLLILLLIVLGVALTGAERDHPHSRLGGRHHVKHEEERSSEYWLEKAQETLTMKLEQTEKVEKKRAKNIILFLGDGMSMHTVTATRNLLGDSSKQVFFEKFPYVGLSKTYCVDRQVADSSCTSTAYLCGVKGNYGTMGYTANVRRYNCSKQDPSDEVESIAKWAQDAGMLTGLITTARVTHASPAGVYAHSANRYWEDDAELEDEGCDSTVIDDIAKQLIYGETGRNLRVILGGGRRHFLGKGVNDEEGLPGHRKDGKNLIFQWLMDKRMRLYDAKYVWSRKGLMDLDLSKTDYLLGLFASSHCSYHGDIERKYLMRAEPTLTEMTEAAIKVLQKDNKGFFLFVEGARIDMAHHESRARKSLEDTAEFASAVQKAFEMTSVEDTLIVVTSDHSHTMTINGYPYRDMDITGISEEPADDDLFFTILSYANGPGFDSTYDPNRGRIPLKAKYTEDTEYRHMATAPLDSETHGGDDAAVFASGPYAQYFSGNYEQTNIPSLMARAANIGPFAV